jgi:ADP-heptose:LPS heptosyltransferase
MDGGYIVICDRPSTSDISSYPIANWQKIIQDIEQRQTGLSIVILQTDLNQAWVTTMVSANGNLKEIAPPDVGKSAAIIAGANLILCTPGMALQLGVATDTYTFALTSDRDSKTIPTTKENCIAISSNTGDLKDIQPETAIAQLWQQ